MIGNGFDLNLGLHTKYNDFLNVYTMPQSTDTPIISAFKKDILQEQELWAYAERAFGEYTDKFDGKKRTVENYCDCHEDFCDALALYLDAEESFVDFSKDNIGAIFAKAISNLTLGFRAEQANQIKSHIASQDGGFRYNFISFNYTTTLDSCVSLVKDTKLLGKRQHNNCLYDNTATTPIHVHGYTSRDMVLGVNDESQINNMALFENQDEGYINQIIKQQTNRINEEQVDENTHKLLQNSDLIYIYGMSIGETDAIWWKRICEIMVKNKSMRIIVYAFDAPPDGRIRRKYLAFEKRRKSDIVKYSSLDDETKEQIKGRIHVANRNLFSGLQNIAKEHDTLPKEIIEHALAEI